MTGPAENARRLVTEDGVGVTLIAPGRVETDFWDVYGGPPDSAPLSSRQSGEAVVGVNTVTVRPIGQPTDRTHQAHDKGLPVVRPYGGTFRHGSTLSPPTRPRSPPQSSLRSEPRERDDTRTGLGASPEARPGGPTPGWAG